MRMSLALLAAATFALGICLGVSGYGGFLVPPLLVWLAGFDDPSRAVAHALLAAAAPSLLGAVLYRRNHRTPRRLLVALCAGTVPGILAGRWLAEVAPDVLLHVLIGVAVLLAGVAVAARRAGPETIDAVDAGLDEPGDRRRPDGRVIPAALGAGGLSGVAGVVVGVGGPLVTTPVLLSNRIPLAAAVGAGLANSVVVCLLGAASLLDQVTLDPAVLLATALPQLVGVFIGVRLHPRVGTTLLTRAVAGIALVVGTGFIVQAAV
jgi:uncharacterized membrane protein YfcA